MSRIQDVLQEIDASLIDLNSLEHALVEIDTRPVLVNDSNDSSPEKSCPTSSLRHANGLSAPQSPSLNETPTKLYNPQRRRHQRHKPPLTSSPKTKIPILCRRLFR